MTKARSLLDNESMDKFPETRDGPLSAEYFYSHSVASFIFVSYYAINALFHKKIDLFMYAALGFIPHN